MIHYSCDRCKREIDPDHDLRYVIRVDMEAATDRENRLEGPSEDQLSELDELLDNADLFGNDPMGGGTHVSHRYDLCLHCYRHFCKDPLGREASLPFGFSKN